MIHILMCLGIFFESAYSMKSQMNPTSGPPPNALSLSSAIYDEYTTSIITIGGYSVVEEKETSNIYSFNISTKKWTQIFPESNFSPGSMKSHYTYLTKSRVILNFFGISSNTVLSDVRAFDLNSLRWTIKELSGDIISGRRYEVLTSFTYNDIEYIAVYGGFCEGGYDPSLYLIDIEKLSVRKMPESGTLPGYRDGATMVYYQGKLIIYGSSIAFPQTVKDYLCSYDLSTGIWELITSTGNRDITYLHLVFVYNDYMYVIYGGIGTTIYNSIWTLNLSTYSWVQLESPTSLGLLFLAASQVESKIYMVFGKTSEKNTNSIFSLDLSQDPITQEYLSEDVSTPIGRRGHCLFTIQNTLLLFGGVTEGKTYLNDLWQFNLDSETWSELTVTGDIPLPRVDPGCENSRSSIFIYGGYGIGDTYFNDAYNLNIKNIKWSKISILSTNDNGRYGTCITTGGLGYYIISGQTATGIDNSILVYNFETQTITEAINNGENSISLVYHKCWIDIQEAADIIYVINGESTNYITNFDILKITITKPSGFVYIIESLKSIPASLSRNGFIKSGDYIFSVFGGSFRAYLYNTVAVVNINTFELHVFDIPDVYLFGHAAAIYKKTIYIFGGGRAQNVLSIEDTAVSKMYKITSDADDSIQIGCSAGTIGENCTPCGPGTYETNGVCKECPIGTYSVYTAAVSITECILCPENTYSLTTGSTYCLDCPTMFWCSVGTSTPMSIITANTGIESFQPVSYKGNSAKISDTTSFVSYSFIASGLLILLTVLFSSAARVKLENLDIFTESHSNEINQAIISRKTKIGGLFTILFYMLSFIIIITMILTFSLDNIIETKVLVPLILSDTIICSPNFVIEFYFIVYGGNCSTDNQTCLISTYITESNMYYDSRSVFCYPLYFEGQNTCEVKLEYTNLYMNYTSFVEVKLLEYNSYVGYIYVLLTSDSSIPDQASQLTYLIFPDSKDVVFKGSTPSIFYIGVTPSIFTSESAKWPSYSQGFHLYFSDVPTKGGTSDGKSIQIYEPTIAKIIFSQSESMLLTTRTQKNTFTLMISTLLGSVFGLLGAVGVIMTYVETFKDFFANKIKKHMNLIQLLQHRKKILDSFPKNSYSKYDFPTKTTQIMADFTENL